MDLISSAYGGYSDDEDTDPWASCKVSVKRSAGDHDSVPSCRFVKKHMGRLPAPQLPGTIQDDTVVDDPSLHGNRVRTFPHERGNWASFVYLPWKENSDFLSSIKNINTYFLSKQIKLEIMDDFHVSLTRTVILRHHWIEGFTALVKKQLSDIERHPFYLITSNLCVYVNEEKTRTFLAFKVEDISGILNCLITKMDCCMMEFQLPIFYKECSHHVSIAWCVGDRKNELEGALNDMKLELVNATCVMNEIRCKIGHMQFSFPIC